MPLHVQGKRLPADQFHHRREHVVPQSIGKPRARLGNERSLVYGALDTQAPVAALIERALPEL